ncbi:peptidoglycan-binding protein [Metabacillus sp. JX24]|uniref:peptidoglycan-binding protein n=1 Tax=Metabacillus sp. JX24 TaxID=3240759 RepID=UPI00350E9F96
MRKKLMGLIGASVLGVSVMFPLSGETALGDRTLSEGMSHSDVKELQEHLLSKSVYPYFEETGYYGPITREAVKDFQEKSRIKVDGIAGPQTLQKIKVLRYGDMGKPVTDLQLLLKEWGLYSGIVDGMYGNGTKNAVASFQQKYGLASDGIAGMQTFAKLKQRSSSVSGTVKELSVTSTAYTASCEGCSGVTKMGVDLNKYPEAKVIAVDPNVIPIGSTVEVEGYGKAIAADIGGAIDGNKIDVFIASQSSAVNWGRKTVKIRVYQ